MFGEWRYETHGQTEHEGQSRGGTATTRRRNASKTVSSVKIHADLSHYKLGVAKTAAGHRTIDIGDAVAKQLRGKTLDEVYAIAAKELGETEKALRGRYQHLNLGMVRMNLGNRLRGAAQEAKS